MSKVTEQLIYRFVDASFKAVSLGLTREEVLNEIKALSARGVALEDIPDELPKMRKAEVQKNRDLLAGKP